MNDKHTAGPWHVGHTMNSAIKKNRAIVANYGTPDEMLITEVWGNEEESECGANARLIAAAPELLEALIKCDRAFANWQIGQIPGRPEDILELISTVRAVIAKAGGR